MKTEDIDQVLLELEALVTGLTTIRLTNQILLHSTPEPLSHQTDQVVKILLGEMKMLHSVLAGYRP